MSAYINFYIRNGEDYVAIGSYSRNSTVYHFFDYYSFWETGSVLTENIIRSVRDDIQRKRTSITENIDRLVQMKRDVAQFNNSIEEKTDTLVSIDTDLAMWKEEEEDCEYVEHYCSFLEDIINPFMNEHIEVMFGTEWCPTYTED